MRTRRRPHGGFVRAAMVVGTGLGVSTHSSMLTNCNGLALDLLTLEKPSRRLMGMRELPGILFSSGSACSLPLLVVTSLEV